jgi:putative ATPase
MDLFDHARERVLESKAPLAARMRPRTLEEFVGQRHVLGPGRLLRRAIQADQLSSLIFYGPPGTGKTTLARIIANTTRAQFTALNAVLAGVADIRKAVGEASERLGQHGQRTILFVDEVHRFNKAQQDALLPHVENGTVILIGATTENPYFEVNKPLVSRSRIFELRPLEDEDVREVLRRALGDAERGYGKRPVRLAPAALEHLASVANGDARAALNALELAVETTAPGPDGAIAIDLAVAEESIQRRAVLYDKEGDAHFDAISAFIKSLRGSDADAALYWMARMVYAGEDPRFILRRMLIFAAEDVGLADPNALRVVASAAQAFDYVGLPEGRFHLSEACLYLATAPKSNSTMAFFDALATVEKERTGDVPNALKDASRDAEGLGHGQGYQYPHAFRDHWVAQQYLPDSLQGRVFYEPSAMGFEAALQTRVQQLREASLAALREGAGAVGGHFAGGGAAQAAPTREAEWRARGHSTLGEHLALLRERVFALAELQRGHLVLDANAGTGLLTWEAARRATEGGVWARVEDAAEQAALADEARLLPALVAPTVLRGPWRELPRLLAEQAGAVEPGAEPVRFERVLARDLLGRTGGGAERTQCLALLAGLLAPGPPQQRGRLVLAERCPRLGERLLAALDWSGAPPGLAQRAIAAEEAVYEDPDNDAANWDDATLEGWARAAGLTPLHREVLRHPVEFALGREALRRWFGGEAGQSEQAGQAGQPAPPGRLAARLGADAEPVRAWLERSVARGSVRRQTAVVLLVAEAVAGAESPPARATPAAGRRRRKGG